MAKSEFLKILSNALYPTIREEGFRGSGATLRRIRGPLIHVFNIQGSSNARGCYVNLGVHLDFLGSVGDRQPAKIREADCVFRTRLEPSDQRLHGRWQYGFSQLEAAKTAEAIVDIWTTEGRQFFLDYETFPESFQKLVADVRVDDLRPHDLWIYARIARELALADRALEFIDVALPRVPPMAASLRGNLKRLRREITE